ncbi:hypothetical protein HF896_00700 [Alicycliphilus denitrificans]|jgi:hypothetical protein|uniref:Uncharacterized protein n=1 Tax=Alicycliphilus denitrificans TaxID=179636 RepID=A0A420KHB6_9BURK|nr:hypothetical protein [Alicycliphilus denitrificans]OJW85456.1 MAG: hypothetical protein BGO66_19685 [Alicycliphilus sp. 69-12]GAO21069.1 hypothetical protein ALISP_0889 [Alicycliphilus sp. B1]MBN9573190.1 hypothetical protein [Alicycliphilus denitrificans]QKD42211.1 hypothetical protein HF896_00700 [Alicycliphilus denitrificans]RKJ99325.1 hypothetical protein CE154_006160 [Alicycliphilus denitrificans]
MTMPTGPRRDARTDEAQTAAEIFRVPILLGLATAVGLVSALVGDGVWDALSWLALAAPAAAVAWAWRAR